MKKPSDFSAKVVVLPGPPANAVLVICNDLADLSRKAADFLIDSMLNRPYRLVLSGGSTPRAVHELLAESDLDWSGVHFFWGDERCVPPESNESNFRMARETLLSKIRISENQVHRMRGELPPLNAATEYEEGIFHHFHSHAIPHFDFVFLGMGEDGHTASLFPNTPALTIADRVVTSNFVEKLQSYRLTMTVPVFQRAAKTAFLVSGKGKAAALHQVLDGPYAPENCPSQLIRPEGELYFFADREALSGVEV
jgi:6-phosphogluconolactonase